MLLTSVLNGCDRLAGTNAQNIALVQKHYDSVAAVDTQLLQRNASQDSLFAIREVQRRTDSIIRLTRPELGATTVSDAAAGTASSTTPAPNALNAPTRAAGTPAPRADLATDAARLSASVVPLKSGVVTDVQRRLDRARALGDSIANAKVNKMVGQNRLAAPADTARGVIQLSGSAPSTRAVLMVDGGRNSVALTGIAVEGLSALTGAEVVVRGMRVSPRDIVVSGFTVRAVKGFAVLDGVLKKGERGGWNIELSDKTGTRALPAIPEMLQPAVGSRIWIDVSNGARPQTYGVIAQR